jgi:hypothetical protein
MAPGNSEQNNQPRRRVDGTVSMVNFAQRKGQTRAIKECKKRKEKKVLQTAKHLRRYRKVMKQEGYEAGTGASRKREEPSASALSSGNEETPPAETEKKQRRPKANPFAKAQEQAKAKKEQFAQNILDKETNEKDKEQKLKQRRKQTKLLSKRSKRGQPIIKNMVDNLLIKLRKDLDP